ncbi:beta-ketoacyl-[acyl-carrier-protein] synthase II, partial [candidate division WOR-3 bacterium]|nr:beta-ketoacyl-[acyl-carrier-protein] synthase II [candidate division WOR-3 bacterium]
MNRRVVVTGVGLITSLGHDAPTTWEKLLAGENGIRRISSFDPSDLDVQIAGEVQEFDPTPRIDFKQARR